MTIDKVVATPAVADIADGASIVTSGFGLSHGFAASLIVALRAQGTHRLCIIANSLGSGPFRAQSLIESHQVDRLIVSFTGRAGAGLSAAEEQIRAGEITVELVPQGTLVERLRAGGAGIGPSTPAPGSAPKSPRARRSVTSTASPTSLRPR